MKKKIMVFMLLFVMLVGVVVPDQAQAEEDIYTWSYVAGKLPDNIKSLFSENSYVFFRVPSDSYDNVGKWYLCLREWFVATEVYINEEFLIYFNNNNTPVNNCPLYYFDITSDSWVSSGSICGAGVRNVEVEIVACKYDTIYGSNAYNVIDKSIIYLNGVPTFEESLKAYDFETWCTDSGLTCAASSNETEDLYSFSFEPEDYHYIIRKNRISGSEYTWYLSQVTLEEDLIYYATNRALADSSLGAAALYVLSGEYASGSTSICNYVYDSSGEGWLYTDNYSVDLGLTNDYYVDDIGITYSSSMPIVYSSTDIYSDKEQSSVSYAASTEYEDSEVTYPDISPTSTPTPTPISNSGSTDLGGNVIAGGGIDFIISLVSSLWNRVYSIPMYVDGFQITLQQLYVYGILAGIVGAAIFAFTRRK